MALYMSLCPIIQGQICPGGNCKEGIDRTYRHADRGYCLHSMDRLERSCHRHHCEELDPSSSNGRAPSSVLLGAQFTGGQHTSKVMDFQIRRHGSVRACVYLPKLGRLTSRKSVNQGREATSRSCVRISREPRLTMHMQATCSHVKRGALWCGVSPCGRVTENNVAPHMTSGVGYQSVSLTIVFRRACTSGEKENLRRDRTWIG